MLKVWSDLVVFSATFRAKEVFLALFGLLQTLIVVKKLQLAEPMVDDDTSTFGVLSKSIISQLRSTIIFFLFLSFFLYRTHGFHIWYHVLKPS